MNLYNSCQHFYTAYEHGKPVGVCLRIIHDNCAGVYVVATLPEFRKNGISTKVMSHALQDACKTGIDTITLKVATDSYAHLFYRKLGFIDVFKCSVHDSITG
ncbi:MAG: GNAT family N-acetyltransferase [Ignavibacteria bacterium]|nr:GNAT family N-acetyltransferase [Ignavibacteria bacterium]